MQKRILLVEDEHIIALQTVKLLNENGFQVHIAGSAHAAIEAVKNQPLDLILMDIELGSDAMDGIDTAKIIMHDYEIPIIFLTNYTESRVVEKSNDVPSYGYVIKNSGPAVLIATINSAFRLYEKQRKAQGRLQHLIENQNDIIYCVDNKTGEFSYISPAFQRFLGYTEADIRKMGGRRAFLFQIIKNNDFAKQEAVLLRFKTEMQQQVQQHLSIWLCKDGSEKYIEDNWVPNYKNGRLESCYGVLRDVTERMKTREALTKALQEKEYLMEEINHRVKNNLTLITSLIHFKSKDLPENISLSDLEQQVIAIGRVYDRLFQRNELAEINFKSYVQELLESVFFSLANYPVTIINDMPEVYLNAKIAVPLGLIMNELAINAIKHGFIAGKEAVFSVACTVESETDQYTLRISNNGRPFPRNKDINHAETLGLRLIHDLLEQLNGTLELQSAPHPIFTFRFPRSAVDNN